jgi:hypothetical protein
VVNESEGHWCWVHPEENWVRKEAVDTEGKGKRVQAEWAQN